MNHRARRSKVEPTTERQGQSLVFVATHHPRIVSTRVVFRPDFSLSLFESSSPGERPAKIIIHTDTIIDTPTSTSIIDIDIDIDIDIGIWHLTSDINININLDNIIEQNNLTF